MPFQSLLIPFGYAYGLFMKVRNAMYDHGIFRVHNLGARTISVGNLTTGGTGKTPLVALITEILAEQGEKVCILTRGYGRRNAGARVLVSDGEDVLVDAETGGDEPVELARKLGGKAVIVAERDRVSAGRWAREKFGITVFILDDGFQHRRVKRDLDIVCIDATNPFGNGRILPAGSLRESFEGLARANSIVLTRANLADSKDEILPRLRLRNETSPIFEASIKVRSLVNLEKFPAKVQSTRSDTKVPLEDPIIQSASNKGVNVGAFCGIGNPEAFYSELNAFLEDGPATNGELSITRKFPDHHKYTQSDIVDLERLATESGAEALITTAKDAVKLEGSNFGLPVFVAEIETEINNLDGFKKLITFSS